MSDLLKYILNFLASAGDILDNIQDVYYLTAIPLAFYIFLLIRKMLRKNWIKNRKVMLPIKLVLLIPFWLLFAHFIVRFAAPEFENLVTPYDSSQTVIIENTDSVAQKFILLGRKYKSDSWAPVYPNSFSWNKSAIYKVVPHDIVKLDVRSGMRDIDIIAIAKLTGTSYPKDKFAGRAFSVPSVPIKVYTHQFSSNSPLDKPAVKINKQALLALLCLTAIFGLLYHSLSTRGKLYFTIPIYSLYAIFGIASAYLIFQISTTLWYLLL